MTQHISAALKARCDVGVSGRIYKRPLRAAGQDTRLTVFPLLVRDEDPALDEQDRPATRWFSLREAVNLVDKDFRSALDAFARRIGR